MRALVCLGVPLVVGCGSAQVEPVACGGLDQTSLVTRHAVMVE